MVCFHPFLPDFSRNDAVGPLWDLILGNTGFRVYNVTSGIPILCAGKIEQPEGKTEIACRVNSIRKEMVRVCWYRKAKGR